MRPEPFPSVEDLLPQRHPMVLLDSIVTFEGADIVCASELHADSLFVREGRLEPLALVEHMAQAVAIWYGLSPREGRVGDGIVVALQGVELSADAPKVGDELRVEAHRLWDDGTLGKFESRVRVGERLLVCATVVVLRRGGTEARGES